MRRYFPIESPVITAFARNKMRERKECRNCCGEEATARRCWSQAVGKTRVGEGEGRSTLEKKDEEEEKKFLGF
ncbi:hypothetical protein JCGZ_19266 [Jatropha curcas]|uniref:Uncharacterized protein n=1 Tax=Jatropha curcas TaxID=180498 RepID=A0A067K3A6_JATCU|nr:hypothetical protein JCGZ_19266 [Jatropha curcas]